MGGEAKGAKGEGGRVREKKREGRQWEVGAGTRGSGDTGR